MSKGREDFEAEIRRGHFSGFIRDNFQLHTGSLATTDRKIPGLMDGHPLVRDTGQQNRPAYLGVSDPHYADDPIGSISAPPER